MYRDLMDTIGFVGQSDPEVAEAMGKELGRQRRNLELIASENIVSPAVIAAMGSVLTNKYAEGYPGKRYYGGCEYVDVVEEIARKRAVIHSPSAVPWTLDGEYAKGETDIVVENLHNALRLVVNEA